MELKQFLDEYGSLIGEKIEKELSPVYVPGKDDPSVKQYAERIKTLLRKPFPVQEEIIKGLCKALYHEGIKRVFIQGEMGVGKTTVALSVIALADKPSRTLVVCPSHLVEKWIREAKLVIPDVETVDLAVKNVISILSNLRYEMRKPEKHEIYVISRDRAKLSYGWKPAYIITKRSKFAFCPQCGSAARKGDMYLTPQNLKAKKHTCGTCGSALWQAVPEPRRYAPADFIRKYLKGFFDFVVFDEIHEYKAGDSLQGYAMGSLVTCGKYFIGLTGTLSGGYADDLFYLLFRINPKGMMKFGGYQGVMNWLKKYGVLEQVIPLEDEGFEYSRYRKKRPITRKRPGISPEVVGKYFLGRSCFIRLSDVIDGLPEYTETVITVPMLKKQASCYKNLEDELRNAISQFKMRAVGAMLQALLSYPDSCVVFAERIEIKDYIDRKANEYSVLDIIEAPRITLPGGELLPKEKELVRLALREKEQNRKALVYLVFTGMRDITRRIKMILEENGLRAGVLPSSVEPKKRERWIEEHQDNLDVLICNPELVKLGLDLVKFPTVVFFETGYSIFTLRQAARRSWRIGQKEPVRVYFLSYQDSMQEMALYLIAKKLESALLTEGELPEGLADYLVDSASITEELVKALVSGRKVSGAEAAWAQLRKKEIEAALGIGSKECIFADLAARIPERASVRDNVLIKVALLQKNGKRMSRMTVKYEDLSKLEGKLQFELF